MWRDENDSTKNEDFFNARICFIKENNTKKETYKNMNE